MYNCLLCGTTLRIKSKNIFQTNLLQCPECKFERLENFPPTKDIPQIYTSSYFDGYGDDQNALKQKFQYYRRLLNKLNLPKGCKIFDIGCGVGFFLKLCKENGHEPYGLDVCASAIERCRQIVDEEQLFCCNFDDYDSDNIFDAIFMLDFIEHVVDPLQSLKKARDMLKPGGHLIITTPSTCSLWNMFMGKRWPHYIPEHLCFFNRKNLGSALNIAGFDVTSINFFPKIMTLHYLTSQAVSKKMPIRFILNPLSVILPNNIQKYKFELFTGDILALAQRPFP